MSTVKVNTISPDDSTQDLTLGASGDTISVAGNDLRVNTLKDKGGNILWTSNGAGTLSNVNSGLQGAGLKLIATNTVSSAVSTIEFTGITNTYSLYKFVFLNGEILP